jgi:hypothetical protein
MHRESATGASLKIVADSLPQFARDFDEVSRPVALWN